MYKIWNDGSVRMTVVIILLSGVIAGTGFRASQLFTLPDQLTWIWTGIRSPWTRSAVVIALSLV